MAKKTSKDLNKNLAETLNEMEVVKETKKVNKKSAPKTSKKVESTIKETITLNIKRLHEDAVIPSYAHDGDIGMDMVATSMEYNEEKDYFEYGTGIAAESERGKAMLLLPRSSVSNTSGYLCNSPGLVDPFTYRGEIKFRYKNRHIRGFLISVSHCSYFPSSAFWLPPL